MDTLNSPQQAAVLHTQGPLLVLAGAGTGKTKVLTHRIAHIINEGLALPQNILAVTFTNKAAAEMKERIEQLNSAAVGINIGTFHSVAARILRAHISLLDINLNSNFTIIGQDEQIKLIKTIATEANIDIKQYAPKLLHVIISRWKDLGMLPSKVNKYDCTSPAHGMARLIYPEYQKQLQQSNALDFGDLLLYSNELLITHANILQYYQHKFQYILIDEYQDTNAVQYIWARMLASVHKNICCVGDDDQSIYSWRGAEVKNILRFEQDFANAKVIKLEQNYRSTSYILQAADSIISNNKQRHHKKLWTAQTTGDKLKIISCWNDQEEARFIGSEIEKLIKQGYQPSNIAVLVRASFQTRALEEVFISYALPYRIIGGLRFYERMEIRDVVCYIRLCLNQHDNLALERIINVPKRSIGNATLKKIRDFALEQQLSLFQAIEAMIEHNLFSGKLKASLNAFVVMIKEIGALYEHEPPTQATKQLLEQSNYLSSLQSERTQEAKGRLENINEMLRAIEDFENIHDFIQHASLVMDNDALAANFGSGAVNIMTLHAAKGLEFEAVFLPGWEENLFPHQRVLAEEGNKGLEEERRIAYVGITRAKQKIYITYAESRRIFSEFVNSIPSRFIKEIPAELCITSSSTHQTQQGKFAARNFNSWPAHKTNSVLKKEHELQGKNVMHQTFGKGVVIKQNGDVLEIAFSNHGVKTIKAGFVTQVT